MYMEILHKTCPDMLSPLYPLPVKIFILKDESKTLTIECVSV